MRAVGIVARDGVGMTARQKFWIKVVLTITAPLWCLPFMCWQLADEVLP